jgi:hypothetical protein
LKSSRIQEFKRRGKEFYAEEAGKRKNSKNEGTEDKGC